MLNLIKYSVSSEDDNEFSLINNFHSYVCCFLPPLDLLCSPFVCLFLKIGA